MTLERQMIFLSLNYEVKDGKSTFNEKLQNGALENDHETVVVYFNSMLVKAIDKFTSFSIWKYYDYFNRSKKKD